MLNFLIIGNGIPALSVAKLINQSAIGKISCLLTNETDGLLISECQKNSIPIFSEDSIDELEAIMELEKIDWLLCINTAKIIPSRIIKFFPNHCLNFHPGRLPDYAGLHTHQWAIRNGESKFSVSIHALDERIDAGAIVAERSFPIAPHDTGLSLWQKCIRNGVSLFQEVIGKILSGFDLQYYPQNLSLRRTYFLRDSLDANINWNLSAKEIVDFVRAGNYYPLQSPTYTAQAFLGSSVKPITVLEAGEVEIFSVSNGHSKKPGDILSLEQLGPIIECGYGQKVILKKTFNDGKLMTSSDWSSLTGYKYTDIK